MAKQESAKKEVVKKAPAKKAVAKAEPVAAAETGAAGTLNIDGVAYSVDSLSRNAKVLINNIRVADRELRRLETQVMLARIARQALAANLSTELGVKKA